MRTRILFAALVCITMLMLPGRALGGSVMARLVYEPTDEAFVNPERGFYAQFTSRGTGSPLGSLEMRYQRALGRSLILRLYYLHDFRNQELSRQFLAMLQADLNAVRHGGVKAILRFAYANGYEPDAPLEIVLRHIEQLQPIFEANYDVIAVVQAGFIGAWGEWHASTHDLTNPENRRTILLRLLDALPQDRMVQVRTPEYKQSIFGVDTPLSPEQAFDGSGASRTGHHNDCFLASDTDYGTYRDIVRDQEYLHFDSRYVPMGGETCPPRPAAADPKDRAVSLLPHRSSDYERHECPNAVREMEYLHWSYLNSGYHQGVLNTWRTDGCMDEIERRLGYRFELVEGEYSDQVARGGLLHLRMELVNTGFAAPFNPRLVELVLRHQSTGTAYVATLLEDPRLWLPGDPIHLEAEVGVPADVPPGLYELLLHLPDPAEKLYGRPEYSIRLANQGLWEPDTGFNTTRHVVHVLDALEGSSLEPSSKFKPYRPSQHGGSR